MVRPHIWWRTGLGMILAVSVLLLGLRSTGGSAPALAGAKPAPTSTMTPKQKTDYKALLAAGRKAFVTVGCGGCHMLSAAGTKATVGPNLNHIGKIRNVKWILIQIANPCAAGHEHAAGANFNCNAMPAGLTKGKTAQAIATFLASQK